MKPPQNYRLGLDRGRDMQTRRAREARRESWDVIMELAVRYGAKTLADYSVGLNLLGHPTARGGLWSPGLVHREFVARGTSAKELFARIHTRLYETRLDVPGHRYREWQAAVTEHDNDGEWLPLIDRPTPPTSLVRHHEFGEGQLIKEVRGKALCRFLINGETVDRSCAIVEVEAFHHQQSPVERQRYAARLRRTYLKIP